MNDIFILSIINSDKLCLIDEEDKERVLKIRWYVDKAGRVLASPKVSNSFYLHRFVMKSKKKDYIDLDHINRNPLDNRKCNLRAATPSQNAINRAKFKGTYSSQYKGVHYNKARKTWKASIYKDWQLIHLGTFRSEIDAAKAYNRAAKNLHGKFAYINKIQI